MVARLSIALDYRPALLSSAGIGRSVRELSKALARRDDLDLHLFGHSLARARHAHLPPSGATLHRLPVPGRSLPRLARWGLTADRLAGSPKVFHWTDYSHPPLQKPTAKGRPTGADTRCAPVLTLHDAAFLADPEFHGSDNSRVLAERTRAAAAQARVVVVPSKASGEGAIALGVHPDRIRVVPFGADHVPTQATPHPYSGRPFLLSVGTIEPRKNHRDLLDAWFLLPQPRPFLVVIGKEGWRCEGISAELRALHALGAGKWIQDADDWTVYQHMQHAMALVYPSRLEGFGFPPVEAMALGTPVIAGATPALEELTDDCAVLYQPGEPSVLAGWMERAFHDPMWRDILAERGRRRAKDFTWAKTGMGYAGAYRDAAGMDAA